MSRRSVRRERVRALLDGVVERAAERKAKRREYFKNYVRPAPDPDLPARAGLARSRRGVMPLSSRRAPALCDVERGLTRLALYGSE